MIVLKEIDGDRKKSFIKYHHFEKFLKINIGKTISHFKFLLIIFCKFFVDCLIIKLVTFSLWSILVVDFLILLNGSRHMKLTLTLS